MTSASGISNNAGVLDAEDIAQDGNELLQDWEDAGVHMAHHLWPGACHAGCYGMLAIEMRQNLKYVLAPEIQLKYA